MKRIMPGVYEGDDVRVERRPEGWRTEAKMRDCGDLIGVKTEYYEVSPRGRWLAIGTYRTRAIAERAADRLRSGTHVFRPGHVREFGHVPGMLVEFSEAQGAIAKACARNQG